jgi:small subunit ribosomal protein S16
MLRIRLRRLGKKRQPYYRVVVADKPDRRDGDFIETLGSYDPHANPPSLQINQERTHHWLSVGAQPSEAAEKILKRAGITRESAKAAAATASPAAAEPAATATTAE